MTTPADGGSVSFVIQSQLMQNYVAESPVVASNNLTVAIGPKGQPVVFSISSNNTVYAIERDASSASGWTQASCGLSATNEIAAGVYEGKLSVVSVDGSSLKFVQQDPATRAWSEPRSIAGAAPTQICAIKLTPIQATLYLTVFLRPPADRCATAPPYVVRNGKWAADLTDLGDANKFPELPSLVDSFAAEPVLCGNDVVLVVPLTPQIYVQPSVGYLDEPLYTNRKTGDYTPFLAVWRPAAPAGYVPVGDVATVNKSEYVRPAAAAMTVMSIDPSAGDPLLLHDMFHARADTIFTSRDDGSFWRLMDPKGQYRALGDVASEDVGPVMVRNDMTVTGATFTPVRPNEASDRPESNNENLIYMNLDSTTEPDSPFALDRIVPGSDGIPAGTFYAHADWDEPPAAYALARASKLGMALIRMSSPQRAGTPAAVPMDAIAAARYLSGDAGFFGIGSDGALYYADTDEWTTAAPGPFRAVAAGIDSNERPSAFAISPDGGLLHVRREDAQAWSDPVSLGIDEQWATVACVRDADDNTFGFAVSVNNGLFWFSQDPTTSHWTPPQPVELQDTGVIQEVRTYTTEIQLADAAGNPQPLHNMTVWSENTTPASLNGRTWLLDPRRRVNALTDSEGKLTVTIEATSVYAPVLRVSVAEMASAECISIEPNAAIQVALKDVDAQALKQLNQALSDQDAGDAATAIRQVMTLAQKTPATGLPKYLGGNSDLAGLQYHENCDATRVGRIDFGAAGPQSWTMKIAHGRVELDNSPEAVGAHLAAHADISRGFGSWLGELGDLVLAAADRVVKQLQITVTQVADGLVAFATFVIGTVTYAFRGLLTVVQQALDLVQGILNSIDAGFDRIADWLGFVFNWGDILLAKDAIAWMFEQTVPLLTEAAGVLKSEVGNGVIAAKEALGEKFAEMVKVVGGNSLTAFARDHKPPADVSKAAGTNIVLNAFRSNPGNAVSTGAGERFDHALSGNFDALFNVVDLQCGSKGALASSKEFEAAKKQLQKIGEHPEQFLQCALSAILEIVKGIAALVLDAAKAIIDALCDEIAALVDSLLQLAKTPWNIPLVSALYARVTNGHTLTALDLFSLMVSIPATVVYKTVKGKAPFEDLDALRQYYTTARLRQRVGLPSAAAAAVTARTLDDPSGLKVDLSTFLGLVYFFGSIGYGVVEGYCDLFAVQATGSAGPESGWGVAAILTSMIVLVGSLAPVILPHDEPFTGLMLAGWSIAGCAILFDTASFCYSRSKSKSKVPGGLLARNLNLATATGDFVLGVAGSAGIPIGMIIRKELTSVLGIAQAFCLGIPAIVKGLRLVPSLPGNYWLKIVAALDSAGDVLAGGVGFIMALHSASPQTLVASTIPASDRRP